MSGFLKFNSLPPVVWITKVHQVINYHRKRKNEIIGEMVVYSWILKLYSNRMRLLLIMTKTCVTICTIIFLVTGLVVGVSLNGLFGHLFCPPWNFFCRRPTKNKRCLREPALMLVLLQRITNVCRSIDGSVFENDR